MAKFRNPGVYIEEIGKLPPSVAEVATAIPAFIGYTEKVSYDDESLVLAPQRITSYLEYTTIFGKPASEKGIQATVDSAGKVSVQFASPSPHRMNYAVEHFYLNGGGLCYIISVGEYVQSSTLPADTMAPLVSGINTAEEVDEVTLLVVPEGQQVDDATDYYHHIALAMLRQCERLGDRFAIIDVFENPQSGLDPMDPIENGIRQQLPSGSFLKYGAVYYPNLKTTLDIHFDEEDVSVDQPGNSTTLAEIKNSDALLHHTILKEIHNRYPVELAPAAAMAGIYAFVDRARGVWKAPANVTLSAVIRPSLDITHDQNAVMNVDRVAGKSVNALRSFTGRGIMVWGARTLAGNDNEWRYVSVRRFFNMVEESVKKSTAYAVFEPNDSNAWVKIRAMIQNYLTVKWREGALAGSKPEDAFYVRVGLNETMTARDILDGRMIIEIGMAVVRPAEFTIFRVIHQMVSP